MLSFNSASVRIANSERAVDECLDIAFQDNKKDLKECKIIIANAPLGHQLDKIAAAVNKRLPHVTVLGNSCSGVTGREGSGESMTNLAIMAVSGTNEKCAYAAVNDIYGRNSYEKGLELAKTLKAKAPNASAIYLICPGIDIDNELVLKAFIEVFGEEVTIFGGTSSDNMRGLTNMQYIGNTLTEHGAWAVAFSDKTLSLVSRATHGFTAYGSPMTITKAEGNKIIELDGKPAWQLYTERLGVKPAPDTICGETIPIGALAEKLPDNFAKEYGNPHILRAITKYDPDGTMYYPTTAKEGMKLWLTNRDEELIFSEQERSLNYIKEQIGSSKPVAVFQSDCLARGRFLFNKIMKDEFTAMIQNALMTDGTLPPWIGMYGFGEYAPLAGKNTYHNYSTALLVFYR